MTKNTKMVVTILSAYVALFLTAIFAAAFGVLEEDAAIDAYVDYGGIVISGVLFVTACVLYREEIRAGLKAYPALRFLLLVVGFCALACISDTLCFTLLPISEMTENEALIAESISRFPLGAYLEIILLAPVVEEVLFRHILQGWLKKIIPVYSTVLAVLLSSALFGFCHVLGLSLEIVPYLLFGLILGVVYERTGNLALVMGIHMANNLVSCIW